MFLETIDNPGSYNPYLNLLILGAIFATAIFFMVSMSAVYAVVKTRSMGKRPRVLTLILTLSLAMCGAGGFTTASLVKAEIGKLDAYAVAVSAWIQSETGLLVDHHNLTHHVVNEKVMTTGNRKSSVLVVHDDSGNLIAHVLKTSSAK
jgi:apolipoprotein N-acyltransferase